MSQIITVKTEIKNFKPLEKAFENLGYSKTGGDENNFTIRSKSGTILTFQRDGEMYAIRGDSDWMGSRQGSSGLIEELKNEYAKEETLAWAKFEGRTVRVQGDAQKGYDIEVGC